jgi:Protein of unknown function (DUF3105)
VSHRQEEKQRRREERLAQEQAEKSRAARRQRMQLALGGLVAVAAIAVVVLLVSGTLGGGEDGEASSSAPEQASNVALPAQELGDVDEAAKAAGCKLTHPEIEGSQHEEREFTAGDYKTNPPTSGSHFPTWAEDGVYEAGNTPELGQLVHTLEHGRIDVQYKPGTPAETVAELEALLAELEDGYHMLLFENPTGMDAAVAATTWGHSLTCPEMNDQVFDAIRTFRNEYIDQGPEDVP